MEKQRKRLTLEDRDKIKELYARGLKNGEIADEIGCSESAIQYQLAVMRDFGTLPERPPVTRGVQTLPKKVTKVTRQMPLRTDAEVTEPLPEGCVNCNDKIARKCRWGVMDKTTPYRCDYLDQNNHSRGCSARCCDKFEPRNGRKTRKPLAIKKTKTV